MRPKAFTIIELLVVIGIISLLVLGAAYNVTNARVASRDSQRVNDAILIGKAIDMAATQQRGAFPKNAVNFSNPRSLTHKSMCADQIYSSTSSAINSIDLTQFRSKAIPKDPSPASNLRTCTDMTTGYIYHTEYNNSGIGNGNIASIQGVTYSLEIGLEREKPADEATFKLPSQLKGLSITDQDAAKLRYRYILNGSYCDPNCYK